MNSFKPVALLLSLFLLSASFAFAADAETEPKQIKFVGTLSGVECTACKRTISRSLAKIKGVKTIRIVKQDDSNHRLEVSNDGSKEITKADAVEALRKADHYTILTWAKSKD